MGVLMNEYITYKFETLNDFQYLIHYIYARLSFLSNYNTSLPLFSDLSSLLLLLDKLMYCLHLCNPASGMTIDVSAVGTPGDIFLEQLGESWFCMDKKNLFSVYINQYKVLINEPIATYIFYCITKLTYIVHKPTILQCLIMNVEIFL